MRFFQKERRNGWTNLFYMGYNVRRQIPVQLRFSDAGCMWENGLHTSCVMFWHGRVLFDALPIHKAREAIQSGRSDYKAEEQKWDCLQK